MKFDEIESKFKSLENQLRISEDKVSQLEARLQTREKELGILQDIEEIKILQRSYGFYYEHGMAKEIADLFADGPDSAVIFRGLGAFVGDNAKKNWENLPGKDSPEFLHFLMMCSGIVHVDPSGQTARGRWYGWGIVAIPYGEKISHTSFGAVYENEYVKQNGVWKIKILDISMSYKIKNFALGFVSPEKVEVVDPEDADKKSDVQKMFDIPDDTKTDYPSGYIQPFHFNHPVTGKGTSDKARNVALKNVEGK